MATVGWLRRRALRRQRAWLFGLLLIGGSMAGCQAEGESRDWPLWERFAATFIDDSGRVIDWSDGDRTVSEGQGYALFFALVADDRDTFDRLLTWTRDNLAAGDMRRNLPAWLWGRDPETGAWTVLDPNTATDADLFMVQALLEAERIWGRTDYGDIGRAMLEQIREQAVMALGDRWLLLPGRDGFTSDDGVRINPSYLPPFQLRFLEDVEPAGPWRAVRNESVEMLRQTAPRGVAADWVLATASGYRADPEAGTVGSYDAIRVYLWAGMNVPELASLAEWRRVLAPAAAAAARLGYVPEHWDAMTGKARGKGPPGFQLAMLPLLEHLGSAAGSVRLEAEARETFQEGLYGDPARYYDQVLALFAEGYLEGRFRFDREGRLMLPWHAGNAR